MKSIILQSKDHRDLLDIIDSLRSKGISRYVDLPQIVVCGDQSSGKSSVLEAVSGLSFPTKDNLCTRFATELVLRRNASSTIKISIIAGPERSESETERLSQFQYDLDFDKPDLGGIIEKAKEAMGLSGTKVFSTDILRVELSGPAQPHLTLVDLPGLFRASNSEQSASDAKTVQELVLGYMRRPRSIILAVVSAKSDFALQDVTEFARQVDPKGTRTLGLITKPDTLDLGSDSEASYLNLAQNRDVHLQLGWHVLRNRDYKMRDATSVERDDVEAKFFESDPWRSMDPSTLGIKALQPRLGRVLTDQIIECLPELLSDVEDGISDCHTRLDRLGSPRVTIDQQRRYLLGVSQKFTLLMKDAVDGSYNAPFFGTTESEEGVMRRLRAVVQNALTDFRQDIHKSGKTQVIIEHDIPLEDEIHRTQYVTGVKELMKKSRGRELSGTFNPMIVGELFTAQCQPWRAITTATRDSILRAVYQTTSAVLNHVAAGETVGGMLRIVNSGIQKLHKDVDEKMLELLRPHYESHPITYNHYLTENVEKAQADRRVRSLEKLFKSFFGLKTLSASNDYLFNPKQLLDAIERSSATDMELYASELATDYMEAYYKVALKRFVDDFSDLAIEQCLIAKLQMLFDTDMVLCLHEHQIITLAKESDETTMERTRYTEKLRSLEKGAADLAQLRRHGSFVDAFSTGKDGLPQNELTLEVPTSNTRIVADQEDSDPHDRIDSPIAANAKSVDAGLVAEDFPWGTLSKSNKKGKKKKTLGWDEDS